MFLGNLGLFLAALCTWACAPPPAPKILWLWERPEDVRFLANNPVVNNPDRFQAAVLAGTLRLRKTGRTTGLERLPRQQSVALPPDMPQIAVVRIESLPDVRSELNEDLRRQTAATILHWTRRERGYVEVQIDYDATLRERSFYKALLNDLRNGLPNDIPLSVTALASWCLGDRWLGETPVDDAVPMLFEMDLDAQRIRRFLNEGKDFNEPLCRQSYGLSTYEPWPKLKKGRRLFLFHPRPWDHATLNSLRISE